MRIFNRINRGIPFLQKSRQSILLGVCISCMLFFSFCNKVKYVPGKMYIKNEGIPINHADWQYWFGQYLRSEIKYPKQAIANRISGRMLIGFAIILE